MNLETLDHAVAHAAAFRRLQRLQPVAGPGTLLAPPTYPRERESDPPQHIFERRRIDGDEVWCVVLNTVQAEARRLEAALLAFANESPEPAIPYASVDWRGTGLEPLARTTSMDAPHRIYDAILRDSLLGDEPFLASAPGQRLAASTRDDATALLEYAPTALVFGAWHSQGPARGLGAKFGRAIVSEIVGVHTAVDVLTDPRTRAATPEATGRRAGVRADPLGASRHVRVYRGTSAADWSMNPEHGKPARPSEINHSSVPFGPLALGVSCDHAEQHTTITLAGIRRLGFASGPRSTAGRALVASLGLLAIAETNAHGYALRSRCDLVPEGGAPLELVHADGTCESIALDRALARALYHRAYERARETGFSFRPLTLTPSPKLVELVRQSREAIREGGAA